jgi:hypothetical protein
VLVLGGGARPAHLLAVPAVALGCRPCAARFRLAGRGAS